MHSERALVVDDNPMNLELISFVLEAEGFEVAASSSAEEALQRLPSWSPGVIIVDVQLPGISGLELVARLRKQPEYAGVSIIAVTSYAMESDRQSAYAAGCDGYISKPIDTRTFAGEIRSCRPSIR